MKNQESISALQIANHKLMNPSENDMQGPDREVKRMIITTETLKGYRYMYSKNKKKERDEWNGYVNPDVKIDFNSQTEILGKKLKWYRK